MATIKLLSVLAGIKTLISAVTSSSGSSDSGHIPQLNASGVLDPGFLPVAGITSGSAVGLSSLGVVGPTAASQPAVLFTAVPYTGGTGTTTLPALYYNAGATAPTTLNTAGTFWGINAPSGFLGYFMDFRNNGSNSVINLDYLGNMNLSGNVVIGANFNANTPTGKYIINSDCGITRQGAANINFGNGLTSSDASARINFASFSVSGLTGLIYANGTSLASVATAAQVLAGLGTTPVLPTGTTATTQTAGDNSTKLATTAYVATAVAGAGGGGSAAVTGIRYSPAAGTGSTDTAATSAQVVSVIGAGVYDASGAATSAVAAQLAAANTWTGANSFTATSPITLGVASGASTSTLRFYQGAGGTAGALCTISANGNDLVIATNASAGVFLSTASSESQSLQLSDGSANTAQWYDGTAGGSTGFWNASPRDFNVRLGDTAGTYQFKIFRSDGTTKVFSVTSLGKVQCPKALFDGNGTASTPGLSIQGTPYIAGTATTNFPQLGLLDAAGAAVTSWSTTGTYFGINMASGFGGNAVDIHFNGGASLFTIDKSGNVSTAGAITQAVMAAAAVATVASAATVAPVTPLVIFSGTTTINTITPPAALNASGKGGEFYFTCQSALSITTAGNIASAAFTTAVNTLYHAVYMAVTAKWYIK